MPLGSSRVGDRAAICATAVCGVTSRLRLPAPSPLAPVTPRPLQPCPPWGGGGQRSGPRRSSASASSSPSRLSRKEAGGERSCFAPGRAGEQLWRRWLPAAVQPGTQPPAGGAFAISPRINGKTGAKPGAGTHPDPPLPIPAPTGHELPPASRRDAGPTPAWPPRAAGAGNGCRCPFVRRVPAGEFC